VFRAFQRHFRHAAFITPPSAITPRFQAAANHYRSPSFIYRPPFFTSRPSFTP